MNDEVILLAEHCWSLEDDRLVKIFKRLTKAILKKMQASTVDNAIEHNGIILAIEYLTETKSTVLDVLHTMFRLYTRRLNRSRAPCVATLPRVKQCCSCMNALIRERNHSSQSTFILFY